MCGRFALTLPHDAVAELFDVDPNPALAARGPRWNVCPTQEVEVVRLDPSGRGIAPMRWGFIPRWYKAPNGGPLLINARAETIAEKPAFAKSARERRCLIPASGFYEWRRDEGADGKPVKTPFWLSPAPDPSTNTPLVAFAGIWREWTAADGDPVATCAIVTTAANAALAPIHHRLPLVVRAADWPLWLGEAGKGAARLMTPPAEDFWAHHQVGAEIGKARADGPGLIAPVDGAR